MQPTSLHVYETVRHSLVKHRARPNVDGYRRHKWTTSQGFNVLVSLHRAPDGLTAEYAVSVTTSTVTKTLPYIT